MSSRPERTGEAFAYTNRRGDTYYLHEGRTKTGKPRYFFAKTIREGAIAAMPDGFEVSESLNAVVSVRRAGRRRSGVAEADLMLVRAELGRHHHLTEHLVQAEKDAIVVHEPSGGGRYAPVMKFEQGSDGYLVRRMTYSGHGGWSHPLDDGDLDTLAARYVRHIGTDDFFELF